MKNNLRSRTARSFAIFISAILLFIATWMVINRQPNVDETPKPFRQVLELNGRLWKKMFRKSARSECHAPAKGKRPRVNGDIGMEEPIDPKTWALTLIGDDQHPDQAVKVTMEDLKKLPRTETATEFRCIEGWSEEMSFAGVKFSDFVAAYHLSPKSYVGLQTPDGQYYVSIDLESMMHDQTLLAYEMNGEELRPENGAPLRLVIPVKYGIKNLKRIGKIFFSDRRPPDYWAEQGYDWYAGL